MAIFNIYYKNPLGPNSMESIIANSLNEAIEKFKISGPTGVHIVQITQPKPGDRR